MSALRKWLLSCLAVLAVLVAGGFAVLLSDRALFASSQYLVETLTPYRLEFEAPSLDRRARVLSVAGVRLYQQGHDGPPLLAVQRLEITDLINLLRNGSLRGTTVRAVSVQAYVDATDSTEDPDPEDWLRQTRWLPEVLELDAIHVITRGAETKVLPVRSIHGAWSQAGRFEFNASVELPRRRLLTDGHLQEPARNTLVLEALIRHPDGESVIAVDGEVTASDSNLNYRLGVEGTYRQVESLLAVLDPQAYGFEGSLRLSGEMTGNLQAADLKITELVLDNRPDSAFTATGSLHWQKGEPVLADLTARGTMTDLGPFAALLGTDLSALGQVDTAIELDGTLSRPRIRHFEFKSQSEEGLAVALAPVDEELYLDETLPTDIAVAVRLSGPDPSVLAPWITPPPLQAGAWEVNGTVRRPGETLTVHDLTVTVEDLAGSGTLRGNGDIEQLVPGAAGGPRFRGLKLRLYADALPLAPLVAAAGEALPFPIDGEVGGVADLLGDEGNLELRGVDASVSALGGSTRLRGSVGQLIGLQAVDLRIEQSGLTLAELGEALPGKLNELLAGARAGGSLQLRRSGGDWRAEDVSLSLAGAERIELSMTGTVRELSSAPHAQLEARYRIRRPADDDAIALPPGAGTAVLDLAADRQLIGLHAFLGATDLTSIVEVTRDGGGITGLQAELHAPRLHLPDLARMQAQRQLAAVDAEDESTAGDRRGAKAFSRVPAYPIALRLDIGDITGSNTRLSDFQIVLRGADRRFTLDRLDVDYAGGAVRLRGVADFSGTAAAISVAGEALSLPVTALAEDLGYGGEIEGILSLRGGLTTQASAPGDLVANIDGSLAGAVADGYVEGAAFDLLMTDLVSWLLLGGILQENTNFECGIAKFLFEDGVARSEGIYLATKHMIAEGKATLDFPHKSLDVRIDPRARSRAVQIPSSVRIRGPMNNPAIIPSPIAATLDASAKLLFLIPELGMKLLGIKPGKGNRANPCAAIFADENGGAR
ncbi:AsmA-like C-terminal region-containing protein [Pseudohaliea sp.]|uniref:AsmA family protein n=1 Tax=Pseudohaliea sp. TaxID=2740289 RepID=UPI0032ED68B5